MVSLEVAPAPFVVNFKILRNIAATTSGCPICHLGKCQSLSQRYQHTKEKPPAFRGTGGAQAL